MTGGGQGESSFAAGVAGFVHPHRRPEGKGREDEAAVGGEDVPECQGEVQAQQLQARGSKGTWELCGNLIMGEGSSPPLPQNTPTSDTHL